MAMLVGYWIKHANVCGLVKKSMSMFVGYWIKYVNVCGLMNKVWQYLWVTE